MGIGTDGPAHAAGENVIKGNDQPMELNAVYGITINHSMGYMKHRATTLPQTGMLSVDGLLTEHVDDIKGDAAIYTSRHT